MVIFIWMIISFGSESEWSKYPGLTIHNKDLLLEVSGASHVNVRGSSETLGVDANGASEVQAKNLKVEKADLRASGTSKITVDAQEILSSKSRGASDIENVHK